MSIAVKYGAIAVASSVVLASTFPWAEAHEVVKAPGSRYGTGLIYDTADQVEQFVAITKNQGDLSEAIEAVNSAVGNPRACGVARINFLASEEVRQTGTFKMFRVLVVGINDGEKWLPVQPPHFQFTIFDPGGEEV
jgi:hypothetical protein